MLKCNFSQETIPKGLQADVEGRFFVFRGRHRLQKSVVGNSLLLCNKNNKTQFPRVGLGQARFASTFHI